MGVWVYVSSSSLFIQLQIRAAGIHALPAIYGVAGSGKDHYLPHGSARTPSLQDIPFHQDYSSYIYIYVCTRCMVYGVFYQSRYGFLANFFAHRLRDRFKKPFEYFSRCFCLEFSRAESFFPCMKKRIGYKNYYYISI